MTFCIYLTCKNTNPVPTKAAKILPTFFIRNPVQIPRKAPNVISPLLIMDFPTIFFSYRGVTSEANAANKRMFRYNFSAILYYLPWHCTEFLNNKGVVALLKAAKAIILEAPKALVWFTNACLTGVLKNSVYIKY